MIEVEQKGTEVTLKIKATTSRRMWTLSFARNVCNEFHAELEADAIREAIEHHRKNTLREFAHGLWHYLRPGKSRWRSALGKRFQDYIDNYI